MFAYDQDQQDWYPAGYWLWNLRGQIAANLSSGNFSNNLPIFNMYLNDLPAIESWTSAQMGGKPGACVPETMRFNGNGYYNGGSNSSNASCATASSPSYNALNIASGPEIAMDIWQQYQDTGSLSFLQQYYPVMEQAVTFLLAYQSVGSDGFLHAVANAHESQWAVQDPTDDIAADQALFPAVISAATLLNTDSSLVSQLRTAESQIEPYARVSQSNLSSLLNSQPTSAAAAASADAGGSDVIGDSYQPSATIRNSENIGLEPVWPYGVIGDSTTVNGDNLTALADRTYNSKPNTDSNDWSYDAVDAARLDMGSQVSTDLVNNTEKYQTYISGLAAFNPGSSDEPYIEQASNVATAMDEALATDYDGTLRIAPAWPSGWDAAGTVYVQGGSKVDVQIEGGVIATAAIQAGTTETMTVRNPWSGKQAEVVNGSSGAVVVAATTNATLSVPVTAGSSYLIEQPSSPTTSLPFAQVTGAQATAAKHLGGKVQIGLDAAAGATSLAASFNDVGITADSQHGAWKLRRRWRQLLRDRADQRRGGPRGDCRLLGNLVHVPERRRRDQRQHRRRGADDHDVRQRHPRVPGLGQLRPGLRDRDHHLHRREHPELSLNAPDWFSTSPPGGGAVAVSSAYQNRQGNTTYAGTGDIFSETVALTAGKTIASVTLPPGGALASGTPAVHVFAISAEGPYGGTAAAVPGTVQAANYDTGGQGTGYSVASVNGTANSYRPDGVDLESCSDTGCGDDIGWTGTGQWFRYTVNVATARTYTVSLRLASPSGVTDALHIASASGANLSGSVNAPDTGGWQTWATVTVSVALPAGKQTLTIYQDSGGWNIHDLTLS